MDGGYEACEGLRGMKSWKRKVSANGKLNVTPKEVGSIIVAAAATALCVIIDILLKEDG